MTQIRKCPLQELNLITPDYLVPYLQYIKEHRRLFLTALKNTTALRFDESYEKMFRFVFNPILERYQVPVEQRKYVMAFYIKGIMAIIDEWLKEDCKDDINDIAKVIQQCVHQREENRSA